MDRFERPCLHWSTEELTGCRVAIMEKLDGEKFIEPNYFRGLLASINAEIACRIYHMRARDDR